MNEPEPKGCLPAILQLFGVRPDAPQPEAAELLPYRLRDDFLSPAELSFFRVLQLAVQDRATIATKVNLADVFFVAQPKENQSYRNKIDRKHVDFLLCDPATMRPRCGIELDDSSHSRPDRHERDRFVEEVFAAAGLPLLRFPARAAYDPNSIASELAWQLAAPAANPPALAAPLPLSGSPICPKCHLPMVQRTATKGPNAGRQFWGCPNYPKCRETA